MSNEIHADYSQNFLLPPSVEDWVPEGHPVRFIKLFVENLDLPSLGFKERKAQEGRPSYSSDLLLKIWLYGYFNKVKSSRELERMCKNELPMIWLCGMHSPDHNTLWRFFRRNREELKGVFKQTVVFAMRNDMIGFALQAVDGSKVLADVSGFKSLHIEDMQKLLSLLEESLEERFSDLEGAEGADGSYELPKELHNKEKLKRLISKGVSELSDLDKLELGKALNAHVSELKNAKVRHQSITDPESRMMLTKGVTSFSYNAQGVVDEKSGVVVGSKVSQSVTDNELLLEMLSEAEGNTGRKSEETVADAGYLNGEELAKVEEAGHEALVSVPSYVGELSGRSREGYNKRNFVYDKEQNVYICPEGKELAYERKKRKKGKVPVHVYRCKSFRECPNRDKCNKDRRGRSIERSIYEGSLEKQVKKNQSLENREKLSKRKVIIEPLFGWIKHNMGLRRWSYRGLKSVNAQWNLVCSVVNLKKIYNQWLEQKLVLP